VANGYAGKVEPKQVRAEAKFSNTMDTSAGTLSWGGIELSFTIFSETEMYKSTWGTKENGDMVSEEIVMVSKIYSIWQSSK